MNYIIYDHQILGQTDDGTVLARVTFPFAGDNTVDLNHTEVDESLRGQGIAGQLLERAAAKIRQEGWKTRCSCSYAQKWFAKHPDDQDLLAKD